MARNQSQDNEWYRDGLHFTCSQCGNCCTGPSGYVWFHYDELNAMAGYLEMLPHEFLEKYARQLEGRWTLDEVQREHGYDCVFLQTDEATGKRGCSIYPVRPQQCRTWPFWPDNLRSRRSWQAASSICPGMTAGNEGEGEFFPIEKIRVLRDSTPLM